MATKKDIQFIIGADTRTFYKKNVRHEKSRIRLALGTAAVYSTKQAANFSKRMAEVNTIARLGAGEFSNLKDGVRGIAKRAWDES